MVFACFMDQDAALISFLLNLANRRIVFAGAGRVAVPSGNYRMGLGGVREPICGNGAAKDGFYRGIPFIFETETE